MSKILEVRGLCKSYPRFSLKDVTFELPSGFIMGLIGPNGAGKSTTIKAIMNLINIDGGKIRVFGRDHRLHEQEIKTLIGYAGEDQHFYQEMSCLWHARFCSRYYPAWDWQLFDRLTDRFEIDPHKKVKELSRGMKVKFALALALAHHPKLMIFDEPTSGLDPIVRHELLQEMLDVIQDESRAILFSTHITEDIEKIADYVTILNKGTVVASDVKDALIDRHRLVRIERDFPGEVLSEHFLAWRQSGRHIVGLTKSYTRFAQWWREQFSIVPATELVTLDRILLGIVKGEL